MNIRPYQSKDREAVQELMAQLQDYLSKMDFLGQLKPYEEYDAAAYFQDNLRSVQENSGQILIAELEGNVVGCVSGWIKPSPKTADIEEYANVTGTISDLFVAEQARDQGVGAALLQSMESFFREHSCDFIRLSVFAPNQKALAFYHREGYQDYSVRVIKRL